VNTTASKVVFVIFILFACVFLSVGGGLALSQQRKLRTYQPVPAQILSSRVESSGSGQKRTYTPVVVFRYEVAGHAYEGRDVRPLKISSGHAWAQGIVGRFQAGDKTTAYCDPQNPVAAFLERHCTFFPYVFVLFPMIFVAIGTAGLCAQTKTSAPEAGMGGWFTLQATSSIAGRRRAALVVALVWWGVGGIAIGHFLSVATRPYETLAIVAIAIYSALGLSALGMAGYYARLLGNIGDAVVSLNGAGISRGTPFKVRVVQPIHANLQIEELTIGVLCRETTRQRSGGKTRTSTRDCYEDKLPVVGNNYVRGGENVTASAQLHVPPDQPASASASYPRYEWFITVKTKLAGSPDYRARFPVTVS